MPIWRFLVVPNGISCNPYLKLDNGIPSHDTGSRLLGMLAPAAFQQWFIGFMRQFAEGNEGILAVDAKSNEIAALP